MEFASHLHFSYGIPLSGQVTPQKPGTLYTVHTSNYTALY